MRVLPVHPCGTPAHQLVRDVSVAHEDTTDRPAISIAIGRHEPHDPSENECRKGLLGTVTVGLPGLGRVDLGDAYLDLAKVDEQDEGVPILHPYDPPNQAPVIGTAAMCKKHEY